MIEGYCLRRGTRTSPKGLQPKQLLGARQRFALAWRLRPAVTKARVPARFLAVCLGCWLPSHPVAGSELDSAEPCVRQDVQTLP